MNKAHFKTARRILFVAFLSILHNSSWALDTAGDTYDEEASYAQIIENNKKTREKAEAYIEEIRKEAYLYAKEEAEKNKNINQGNTYDAEAARAKENEKAQADRENLKKQIENYHKEEEARLEEIRRMPTVEVVPCAYYQGRLVEVVPSVYFQRYFYCKKPQKKGAKPKKDNPAKTDKKPGETK